MTSILDKIGRHAVNLSDEVYVIRRDYLGLGYQDGTRVRLIAGINNSPIPGYHWSPGYVTVCAVDEEYARHVGHKIEEVVLDDTSFYLPKLLT
jgi:hypothetical protein